MDLGSMICTPKRPACVDCPWTEECEGRRRRIAETLPKKGAERARPLKRGAAFVVRDAKGAVLVVKRPEKGLLGGMLEPPLGPWSEAFPSKAEALLQAPFRAAWTKCAGIVRHGFTHFELEIEVYVAELGGTSPLRPSPLADARAEVHLPRKRGRKTPHALRTLSSPARGGGAERAKRSEAEGGIPDARWIASDKLKDAALPTVMRKIIAHGLDDGGPLYARRERPAIVGGARRSK
jgi:A/G-specific adenine glycosylase